MKRKQLGWGILLMLLCLLCGCRSQAEQDESLISVTEPAETASELTVTPKEPDAQEVTASAQPQEPEVVEGGSFYKEFKNGISISIDNTKVQNVTIKYNGNTGSYSWEHTVTQKEPVCIEARYHLNDQKAIYVLLPWAETSDYLSVPEYAGEVHIIDPETMNELEVKDTFEEWKEYTYVSVDDNSCLVLEICPYTNYIYNYPTIEIHPEDEYEIVYDEYVHYTKTLTAYERVGVSINGKITWLGLYTDDVTFDNLSDYDGEMVSFYPYDLTGDGSIETLTATVLGGTICEIPLDCKLDLDQDGKAETIGMKAEGLDRDVLEAYDLYKISVGKASITDEGMQVNSCLYAASFDAKTIQLLVTEYGASADFYTYIYRYEDGEITACGGVGCLPEDITIRGEYFLAKAEICHFQCYNVTKEYQYQDGKVKEVPLEFYDMGNTVTATQEIQLYETNSTDTLGITISTGSDVIVLGSDLKEWVELQNVNTGETGWLRVINTDVYLPDGTIVYSDDLFSDLFFYG